MKIETMVGRAWLVAVVCVSAMGCVPVLNAQGAKVQPSDEQMVKGCKYLGDVHGYNDADVRNQAGQRGATHMMTVSETPGGKNEVSDVLARAYQCGAR